MPFCRQGVLLESSHHESPAPPSRTWYHPEQAGDPLFGSRHFSKRDDPANDLTQLGHCLPVALYHNFFISTLQRA